MKRKGAIQMSLGFIVAVVFAVILLSLAIVWIQGTVEQIRQLTEDQIRNAHAQLDEVFETQQTVFALSKNSIDNPPASRGRAYAIAIGFKNNLDSSMLNADNTAYFSADVSAVGGPGGSSKLSEYGTWIECVPESIWVEKGDIVGKITCAFAAPSVADAGTYTYLFEGCTDKNPITSCSGKTKFGGAPLSLQVVIK
jgi:type II secretory pathway pseudopilin PulG